MGSEIKFILFLIDLLRKVNPSTPRSEGLNLLRVRCLYEKNVVARLRFLVSGLVKFAVYKISIFLYL
jgi:hypothetical protein